MVRSIKDDNDLEFTLRIKYGDRGWDRFIITVIWSQKQQKLNEMQYKSWPPLIRSTLKKLVVMKRMTLNRLFILDCLTRVDVGESEDSLFRSYNKNQVSLRKLSLTAYIVSCRNTQNVNNGS